MNNFKKITRQIIIVITILLIGFIVYVLNETKDEINANLINVDEKLNSFYNENIMMGFAVAVFNKDSIIYKGGFGYADKKIKFHIQLKHNNTLLQFQKQQLVCRF